MSNMAKLLGAVNKAKSAGGFEKDDKKFYYPARDAAGNGSAVIRFLPGKTDDDIPFVKTYAHGFKGAGGWFIEDCPTTIDKPCYACEQNSILWNTNLKANQDIVRERKRKISYIANILIVSDPKNPENEGKVFQYKFGTKIFDKIVDALQPVEDELDPKEPCNVFDLKEGANFILKIRKVEGQTNYDKSEFKAPSPVKVDLSLLESLDQFTAPERFKTPEELQRRFDKAVGNTVRLAVKEAKPAADEFDEDEVDAGLREVEQKAAKVIKPAPKVEVTDDADDDIEALMKSLAS